MFAAELFAGGGGLAVGLRRAGVAPVAAVELDAYAAQTFKLNHPNVALFDDVRRVSGKQLLLSSPSGSLDVLAACPPCQGFSTLTSKYRREDDRNQLVAEVGRLAKESMPFAIMMENVPGLSKKGKPILDSLVAELEALGYVTNVSVLQVADFGVPQTRRRLVLLAGLGFKIDMPSATHSRTAVKDTARWRSLRDAIGSFPKEAVRIDDASKAGGFSAFNWHVVRRLGEANLARLRNALPGESRKELPIELRPDCHRDDDFGFRNTYGRMTWDRPSSTITAGCLSPSKGRFGHPDELRTISLREAATLQTFPENFRFADDRIDKACSVIGNALPCLFAERIAAQVRKTVERATAWIDPDLLAMRQAVIAASQSG